MATQITKPSDREDEIARAAKLADRALKDGNRELCVVLIERLYALYAENLPGEQHARGDQLG